MNILFVCSKNLSRSPTAETIYKDHAGLNVKSAGTEPSAEIEITATLVNWSEAIFAMETKHKESLLERFPNETKHKQIIVLGIPDVYKSMDAELIEKIRTGVSDYLDK
jgi:predicted protein tyrosine phosphatase